MPRTRLTDGTNKTAAITERLDTIASELEESYPKFALTIDQISDTLERNSAQIGGWDLKDETEKSLIGTFEQLSKGILYYMRRPQSAGSLKLIKEDINNITDVLNRFLELRQAPAPQQAQPATPARPAPQQAQPATPARPAPQQAQPATPARPAPQQAQPATPARPTPR